MKIILCLPGSNFSANFVKCLIDTLAYLNKQGIQVQLSFAESNNIYMVRSKCLGADVMRGKNQKPFNGMEYDYIMWIDSDQVWNPEQIQKLINHNKDIVGGYYAWQGGQGLVCGTWDEKFFKTNGYMPFLKDEDMKDKTELMEVDYIGFGFLLVKKGVFESLEYPWFTPKFTEIGDVKDFAMEDVSWCLDIKDKGYKILVDPTIRVGHEKLAIY